MQGQGTTRIDLMLANPSAVAAVIAHYSRWDLVQERHVPQEVILDMQTLDSDEIIQRTAGKVTFADSEESEEELSMEDAYNEARSRYKEEYERALDQRDVNKAHVVWNKVAEVAILAGKGEPVEQAIDKVERAPWRGAPLEFKQRQRTKLVDRCGHPTVHRQKEINNLRNKLSDIRARLRRWEERHLNTEKTGEVEPACVAPTCGTAAAAQLQEKSETEVHQNSHDFAIQLWVNAEERFKTLIGTEAFETRCPDLKDSRYPSAQHCTNLIEACSEEYTSIASQRGLARRQQKRNLARWDWEKNHGRRAFKNSRTNYQPPTSTIQHPTKPLEYLADPKAIHDQFLTTWQKVYCKHPESAPIWETFDKEYGKHIPVAHFHDEPYKPQEFIAQLDKMKNIAAGFDGWTRDALRALPLRAWQDRADIENLAKQMGVLPEAYLHVPSPMLPKGQALRPEQHRGITIFSMLHRTVYGVLWQKLKHWQEAWIEDNQHGGRIGGEFLADAWDLQATIETAEAEKEPLIGALLDYEKFFDMFHPSLVRGMLEKAGCPPGIAAQLHFLYTNLRRYIRVAGTYGAVIAQTNGIGQGCSLSIIVANLYVATLFKFLRANFEGIDMGAFLDDRNITTDTIEKMINALAAVERFDKTAGHRTNFAKSCIFASEQKIRDTLRKKRLAGDDTKIITSAEMVGHEITVKRGRTAQATSKRSEKAAQRAKKVTNMADQTRKQRARLITSAVIPAAISGTMWSLPSKKAANSLRGEILRAVWGKGRKLRAPEIVLGVLHDPTRADPLGAIVYKRLADARRLMRKDAGRLHRAIHTFELTKEERNKETAAQRASQVREPGSPTTEAEGDGSREQQAAQLGSDHATSQPSQTNDHIHHKLNGPVNGMRQAAALLGGKLNYNEDGFYIAFPGSTNHFFINKGANAVWKQSAKQVITNAIILQLAGRTINPDQPKMERTRRGRTDLYGLTGAVDTFATTALLKNKACTVLKKHKDVLKQAKLEIDTDNVAKDPITNQRLQAAIAGALRAPDRIFEAGIVETPQCKYCGEECATLEHTVWGCPKWNQQRQPYLHAIRGYIEKVAGNDPARRERITQLMTLPCWFNCGVAPESNYFTEGGAPIPSGEGGNFGRPNLQLNEISQRNRDWLVRESHNRIVAFTDGAACHPDDPRRRRASWGVHYALDHPYNANGPLTSEIQTVYRAELAAILHVIKSANVPTKIITDCQAVANQAHAIMHDREIAAPGGDHADLWEELTTSVRLREDEFFEIEWIASHIDVEKAQEVEVAGGFLKEYIVGNHWADVQAKEGLRGHAINDQEYADAEDRAVLTILAQALILEVWKNYFEIDTEAQQAEEEDEPPPKQKNSGSNDGKIKQAETDTDAAAMEWQQEIDRAQAEHDLANAEEMEDKWQQEMEAAAWLQGEVAETTKGAHEEEQEGNTKATQEKENDQEKSTCIWGAYTADQSGAPDKEREAIPSEQINRRPMEERCESPNSPNVTAKRPRRHCETGETDRISIPDAEGKITIKTRGTQSIKGRGNVDISVKHPIMYVEPVRRWLNLQRWKSRDPEKRPNSPSETVTHLECLVDFELTTGI